MRDRTIDRLRTGMVRLLAFAFFAIAVPGAAFAQGAIERLLMPGDLIEGHAKLEQDCASCHKSFSRAAQKELCLNCHKDIATDVRTKSRFHGKAPAVASNDCRQCHADHKGRKADIVQLERSTFDHSMTNFSLEGRHAAANCSSCHEAGKKFRAAPSACIDCHRQDDVHRGKLKEACADCHSAKGWKPAKEFDHARTSFPLTGSHVSVECKGCHAGERYKGAPTTCFDCHRQRDVHNGGRGPKCESCHTTKTWAAAKFDHDIDTKFPLRGKHGTATCESCHKLPPKEVKLSTACGDCHQKDDPHKGQLGPQCQNCHSESGFKFGTVFDHDKTKFPLLGKHQRAQCTDCHTTKAYKDASTACASCHRKDDRHEGRFGSDCSKCHNPAKWTLVSFDHSRTRFALTGKHAQAGCYQCHTQKRAARANISMECVSCHRRQDRHRGAFGPNCANCHSTRTFATAFIKRR